MLHSPITVYRTEEGLLAQRGEDVFLLGESSLDVLFKQEDPAAWLATQLSDAQPVPAPARTLAPIENQEVWAAGVTYLRSRDARIDESKDAGGGTFYDRVYAAARPELFFKATPHRVVGSGGAVRAGASTGCASLSCGRKRTPPDHSCGTSELDSPRAPTSPR